MADPTDQDEATDIKVGWGDKNVSVRSRRVAEFLTFILLLLVCLGAWLMWQHMGDARAIAQEMKTEMKMNSDNLSKSLDKLSASTDAQTRAQREMNCLISLPQEKREAEYQSANGFCRRISRDDYR